MIPNPKEVEEGTHSEQEDSGVNPCSSSKVEEVNSLEEEEAEGDNSSISDGVDQGRFVLFSLFRSSFAFFLQYTVVVRFELPECRFEIERVRLRNSEV